MEKPQKAARARKALEKARAVILSTARDVRGRERSRAGANRRTSRVASWASVERAIASGRGETKRGDEEGNSSASTTRARASSGASSGGGRATSGEGARGRNRAWTFSLRHGVPSRSSGGGGEIAPVRGSRGARSALGRVRGGGAF